MNFLFFISLNSLLFSQVSGQYINAEMIKEKGVLTHSEVSIDSSGIDTIVKVSYFEHGGMNYRKFACKNDISKWSHVKEEDECYLTECFYNDKNQLVEVLTSSGIDESGSRWYIHKETFKYNKNGLLEKYETYQPADEKSPQIRYYTYIDSLLSSEIIYWQAVNKENNKTEIYRVDSTVYLYNKTRTKVVGIEYRDSALAKKWTTTLAVPSDTCSYEFYDFSKHKSYSGYNVYDELGRCITEYHKTEHTEKTYFYNFYPNGLPKEWGQMVNNEPIYKTLYIYEYRNN
ncbi:MAG: hypothetical protein R3279_05465 [Putridiphycobacter sp.]|nr:hypothetical protein [Putridiphycobacter sp.]